MRASSLLFTLISLAVPSFTQAANISVLFKCHVTYVNNAATKQATIVQRRFEKANTNDLTKALLDEGIYAPDGKTRLSVVKVHECVEFKQKFSGSDARYLDKNMAN